MDDRTLRAVLKAQEALTQHERVFRESSNLDGARQAPDAAQSPALRAIERLEALRTSPERQMQAYADAMRDAAIPPGTERAMQDATARLRSIEIATSVGRVTTQALERATLLQRTGLDRAFADNERHQFAMRITAPWADANNIAQSLESIDAFSKLSKALQIAPFGNAERDAIRQALGDWRSMIVPDLDDWQTRMRFYHAHGFDQRLSALPEPAFSQALQASTHRAPVASPPATTTTTTTEPPSDELEHTIHERMIDAYSTLREFERELRTVLHQEMEKRYGRNWSKQRIPPETLESWRHKRKTEGKHHRPTKPLIEYADFADYVDIIIRNDNWKELFAPIFHEKDEITVSFRRLKPLRDATMHGREITKEDHLVLTVEIDRIRRAIRATPTQSPADEQD